MALIGITNCRKLEDYRQAVLHVGGEVRILDPTVDVRGTLNGLDGVMLTGGGDVAPSRYGEQPHQSFIEAEAGRDDFELELVKVSREQNLPTFAICRGIQVLNVAYGGTLIQDIPSQLPGALPHTLEVPQHQPFALAHEIWVDRDTLLWRLMRERLSEADAVQVNSRHHQAVKQVAPGLISSATAPDGVIEAIEDPSSPFCLGVQWHPENFWRTGEFRPLFEGFLEATSKR